MVGLNGNTQRLSGAYAAASASCSLALLSKHFFDPCMVAYVFLIGGFYRFYRRLAYFFN